MRPAEPHSRYRCSPAQHDDHPSFRLYNLTAHTPACACEAGPVKQTCVAAGENTLSNVNLLSLPRAMHCMPSSAATQDETPLAISRAMKGRTLHSEQQGEALVSLDSVGSCPRVMSELHEI
jgi:hypothetical protein